MDKIRVGIVGAGQIAQKYHIPGYQSLSNVEVVIISDVQENLAKEVADKFQIPNICSDYKELLRYDLDCISICVPNKFHAPITIAAAKAGKHVLCEKPIALNLKEADAMIHACEENNVCLMLEFPMRFDPGYIEAKWKIDKGLLGKVVMAKSTWAHGGPEKWSPKGRWFFDNELAGGGALLDLGIHNIDILQWLIGSIKESKGYTQTTLKDTILEDNGVVNLMFENGALGIVDSSWTVNPQVVKTEIYGTKGRMVIKDFPVKAIDIYTSEKEPERITIDISSNTGIKDPHFQCIHYFISCIANQQKPISSTAEDGREALKAVIDVYSS